MTSPTSGSASAFSDVVVTGIDTRQTWLTTRRRGRLYHPSRQCPVELDARRRARPVRGRLSSVILCHQQSVILEFYPMQKVARYVECGRAGHAGGCKAIGRSCLKRVRDDQGASQIPRRESDHSRKANRVQGSTGSINARWRREPGGGNTDLPGRCAEIRNPKLEIRDC